jgi:predicted ferric reductase
MARAGLLRTILTWSAVAAAVVVPLVAAGFSEQLAWRHPIYIAAGFFGIGALALLFVQPLLMSRRLPGLSPARGYAFHRWTGALVVAFVLAHVGGLWLTSAPDVIDALLFTSPTPFSPWGVVAMWAVFITAILASVRRKVRLRPATWRRAHLGLAVLIVGGSIVHALLIEGTMEVMSKAALCGLVALATVDVILQRRA